MTDRELLEAAAKVLGWRWSVADRVWYDDQAGTWTKDWNPLTDDGDRYRLARAAELRVDWNLCCVRTKDGTLYRWTDDGSGDDEAHTIVRAAAAMAQEQT